eukprot:CAMPEP_0182467996 /NCGR_PEP_ID=MMETSP1319-20130603/14825_1 /TAXON_ID=172717 /ORGANISM="Bolidomonas pacifica, Strain RCC208" /LENGTH=453 /DNA_ID=CAMNT_0024668155 /DNA_START=9 /DNA_END=1370 /DNA_ORIENTATION=-
MKISRIIVLMLENRSFDHLLGYSKLPLEGIPEGQTVPMDPDDVSKGSKDINPNGLDDCIDDPLHGFDNIHNQINGGDMDGWLKESSNEGRDLDNPISMFTPTTAPIINTLAEEFAVFDHYYCSVPSSTDPNRAYAMSGTSNAMVTNFNGTLWSQQSHIDWLNSRNVSAGGYYQTDLWALGYFEDYHKEQNAKRIKEMDNFYTDLKSGDLPAYTWLQPRSSVHDGLLPSWQHPDARVSLGEELIKDVYEAVRADPLWNETLFVITYDEHGGYYDHVDPPATVSPDGIDADNGFEFDKLGIRVPALAVSPWTRRGEVYNGGSPSANSFDHASLIRTTNELLGVEGFMTARDEWSKSFAGVLTDEYRDDTPATLPEVYGLDGLDRTAEVEYQKSKPINEHLAHQMMMFCKMHYPHEFEEGKVCRSAEGHVGDQGMASRWIKAEQDKFLKAAGRQNK